MDLLVCLGLSKSIWSILFYLGLSRSISVYIGQNCSTLLNWRHFLLICSSQIKRLAGCPHPPHPPEPRASFKNAHSYLVLPHTGRFQDFSIMVSEVTVGHSCATHGVFVSVVTEDAVRSPYQVHLGGGVRMQGGRKSRTNPDPQTVPRLLGTRSIQLLLVKVVKKVMITGYEVPRCRNNLHPWTNPDPQETEKSKRQKQAHNCGTPCIGC